MVKVMAKEALTIMGFRPYLSANFPHIGATKPETKAVEAKAIPENSSTLEPVTPRL